MEREVFVLPNGESFMASEVFLAALEAHEETAPCIYHEPDGSIRKGTMRYTVESADVSFSAFAGLLKVGQNGQLSARGDQFFEVTISSIQSAEDHVRISGRATRKYSFKRDQ
jgi:hypothetical protein